jgi:hypothetical protein
LSLRLLILVSGFRRAKTSQKIVMILASLGVLVFLGTIFFVSLSLLRFLGSPQVAKMLGEAGVVLESLPVLILSGAFLGILFTSFGLLLQALYLAGDMDFLLSAPIPIRAVFISKLLRQFCQLWADRLRPAVLLDWGRAAIACLLPIHDPVLHSPGCCWISSLW